MLIIFLLYTIIEDAEHLCSMKCYVEINIWAPQLEYFLSPSVHILTTSFPNHQHALEIPLYRDTCGIMIPYCIIRDSGYEASS
jgi:hypothetical protein